MFNTVLITDKGRKRLRKKKVLPHDPNYDDLYNLMWSILEYAEKRPGGFQPHMYLQSHLTPSNPVIQHMVYDRDRERMCENALLQLEAQGLIEWEQY